ncbi:hypothetical protein ACHAPE_007201 [Trichoderma viride]
MSEGTGILDRMRNAFRRFAKRLFHRSKRRSNHSTPGKLPTNKASPPPQETPTLGTGTNAKEQHQAPNWPLTTDSHQPSSTLNAQASSAREDQAPLSGGKEPSASPQYSRNETHDSQLSESLRKKPQGSQEGYLKPALKRKAVNATPSQGPSQSPSQGPSQGFSQGPSQGSSLNYISESPYRYLSLEDSSTTHGEANAQSRDEDADGPIASGSGTNNDGAGHQEHQEHQEHHEHYTDHTIHPRPAAVHEEITPHVHTIYEPTRTLSFHLHEHRTLVQPIVDPAARQDLHRVDLKREARAKLQEREKY